MTVLATGAPAPAWKLPGLEGPEIAAPADRPLTLVVFLKTSCPTCRWALPFFQSLFEKSAGASLAVVGVSQDDEAMTREFASELGLEFPIAIESEPWPISAAHRLETVPTFFLLDDAGRVVVSSVGFARDDLREAARLASEHDGVETPDPFPEGQEIPEFRPG